MNTPAESTVPSSTRGGVPAIPPGMPTLTPHLICHGAAAAIDFYQRAFNAVEQGRLAGPDGKLIHAMLRIGDSPLMLVDEFPEWGNKSPTTLGGTPVALHLYVADVDAAFAQATSAGATVRMPVADMFWGDRYGVVTDPFGHQWSLATHIKDMSPGEMQAAAQQAMSG